MKLIILNRSHLLLFSKLFKQADLFFNAVLHELHILSAGNFAAIDLYLIQLAHLRFYDIDLATQRVGVVTDQFFFLGEETLIHLGDDLLGEMWVVGGSHQG